MFRSIAVTTVAILALAVVGLACGAPSQDAAPGLPAAQATDVRRTAVAEVQRIIANGSTPTPEPEATSTPVPTCQGAIWWSEARSHVGETRRVQGTVVETRPAPNKALLLELGQPYPDPVSVAVLLSGGDAQSLNGKSVCVLGRIDLAEGRPTLQVRDRAAIQVLD